MEYKDDYFPFRTVLSLEPLIDYWKEIEQNTEGIKSNLARQILEQVEQTPELRGELEDVSVLDAHTDMLDMLMSILLPVGMCETSYSTAILPWKPESFYSTPAFERENMMEHLLKFFALQADLMSKGKTVNAYLGLVSELFGYELPSKLPMFFPAEDEATGLMRYFKIDFDTRFSQVKILGQFPEFTKDDLSELMNNIMDLDLWKKKLPPELIEFHGFAVLTAVEVTEGQIVSMLKNDLLQKDALNTPAKIEQIQCRIRSLMRMKDLEVGLVAISSGEFDKITSIKPLGRSLLMKQGAAAPSCPMWKKSLYAEVCDGRREPAILQDLQSHDERTGFEQHLIEQGYNNLLLAPLYYEDDLVGILEIASPKSERSQRFYGQQARGNHSTFLACYPSRDGRAGGSRAGHH